MQQAAHGAAVAGECLGMQRQFLFNQYTFSGTDKIEFLLHARLKAGLNRVPTAGGAGRGATGRVLLRDAAKGRKIQDAIYGVDKKLVW